MNWTPQWPAPLLEWITTLGVALAAMLVAEIVFHVGARLVQRATRTSPGASTVMQSARRPARWMLPLIALTLVWHAAPENLPGLHQVQRLTALALIATATWLVVRGINAFAAATIERYPLTEPNNLEARRIQTQARVIARTLAGMVTLIGIGLMLMTFPAVRQVGASLLASAGVLGIIAGFAARPVLGNLIAGLQIGLTQPIRLDDVVIVEGEWGVIEEIGSAYVVVRIWDQRRLVVPLQWWIEKPFQNWTRTGSDLTGTVFLWVDYRMPLAPLREALQRACESTPLWDRRVALLQVTEAGEQAMQLRCLVTAASAPEAWDLRCLVREQLVDFIQREYPQYLPTVRAQSLVVNPGGNPAAVDPAAGPLVA